MGASRSVWSGFIRFGLVSVPVKAYTGAVSGGGNDVRFNQLHSECNSRIQYKKTCPLHGEVTSDQIVSGYEFSKGEYVVVDPAELDKLRTPNEKAINVQSFIPPGKLDPRYFAGKTYYLMPHGPVAGKPYALLTRTMTDEKLWGFATVVFQGKDQIVALRPMGHVLVMSFLSFTADLKDPIEFETDAPRTEVAPDELRLAKTLTGAMKDPNFDISEYRDHYSDKVRELIEAKVQGKEVVAPPAEEPVQIINLMDALQKSLAATKKAAAKKPPKLAAPSVGSAKQTRRRKSS